MATNFFRDRRERLGLTQRQIADRLKMTPAAVSQWECGDAIPKVPLYDALAEIYRVSPERIAVEVMKLGRREKQTA